MSEVISLNNLHIKDLSQENKKNIQILCSFYNRNKIEEYLSRLL